MSSPQPRRQIRDVMFIAVAVTLISANAHAATLLVPQDFATIQAAIDKAQADDTVLASPGTYKERVRLKVGVTLKSAGDDAKGKLGLKRAEATIIDGGGMTGEGPGVAMAEAATLDGFTVTNVGVYDDAEWTKHHATQGNEQPHEHIGRPGMAGVSVIGVTCSITNNIVHHIGYTGIAITVIHNVCYENIRAGIGVRNGSTAYISGNELVRTGGMPPMIAVREGSSAVVTGNTIRGGGVAGVMVEGTATVTNNLFDGNGPRGGGPPNFAVWVHAGSEVKMSDNTVDRWRHALFANGAKSVSASGNRTANFMATAIVVQQSETPAHVFGNVAVSENAADKSVSVTGPQGIVSDNELKAPETTAN